MTSGSVLICILVVVIFLSIIAIITSGDDKMYVPWVSHNPGFGGGRVLIERTKLKGHRFAKAADDGPDGRWKAGDLLIFDYNPKHQVHFAEGRFYIFVKYMWRDGVAWPQMHVFKCVKWEHTKRPEFEVNLDNDFKCIGELRGIQMNGKNIMY